MSEYILPVFFACNIHFILWKYDECLCNHNFHISFCIVHLSMVIGMFRHLICNKIRQTSIYSRCFRNRFCFSNEVTYLTCELCRHLHHVACQDICSALQRRNKSTSCWRAAEPAHGKAKRLFSV